MRNCFGLQVEPFNRSLQELQVDCMINGRRRDHGADRARLEACPHALVEESRVVRASYHNAMLHTKSTVQTHQV